MSAARPSLVRVSMMMAIALIAAGVLTFLTSIIIARSVGVAEFGYYSITISLQSVAILFSHFGLGVAVAKFVAEYIVRDFKLAIKFAKAGFRLVLIFALVTASVYFALADLVGNGLYGEPAVADLIPLSAMVSVSSAMLGLSTGIAQGNQRMKLVAIAHMLGPVISLSVIVSLLPSLGVKAPFIGLFVAQLTVALFNMFRLTKTGFPMIGKVETVTEAPHYRMLLSFAVPSVMSGLMITPVFWLGNTVLTLESGFLAMGFFGVAMVFFQALNALAASLFVPLVPRVSEMSVHTRDAVGPLISRSMRTSSFVFFPLFFAVALFSWVAIDILYGSDFSESSDAAYMMVTASFFYLLAAPVSATTAGLGRMWVSLGLNLIWASIFIALVLLLVPSEGTIGLGTAFALSYGIHVCNSLVVANTVLRLKVKNVTIALVPSAALFALASPPVLDLWEGTTTVKVLLLAAGSLVMAYLGRAEYKLVLDRILRR